MHIRKAREIASRFNVTTLLTRGNPKTAKGEALGYLTAILHLSPHTSSGKNVCPMAELAGCIEACLTTKGRGGIAKDNETFIADDGRALPNNVIQHARINKTRFYHAERGAFMTLLAHEISLFVAYAHKHGFKPAIRLNGTSDIRYEHGHYVEHKGTLYQSIFDCFPSVQFYDYTKIPNRKTCGIDNYHLTWSFSNASIKYAQSRPEQMSWAVIFRVKRGQELPSEYLGRKVIDADTTDLRFLDPAKCIAGLRAKGSAIRDTSGFVIDC